MSASNSELIFLKPSSFDIISTASFVLFKSNFSLINAGVLFTSTFVSYDISKISLKNIFKLDAISFLYSSFILSIFSFGREIIKVFLSFLADEKDKT